MSLYLSLFNRSNLSMLEELVKLGLLGVTWVVTHGLIRTPKRRRNTGLSSWPGFGVLGRIELLNDKSGEVRNTPKKKGLIFRIIINPSIKTLPRLLYMFFLLLLR